ncbi:MAG: hypothetical protein JO167_02880 [Alphaproteobacteria bacterium]|nr:hypothetical protein [Alphaproteobacteria bacterium]
MDDNHLILENGRHQRVMAKLVGVCPGLNFALGIRIKSVGGISGLSCIERGDEVLVNDAGFHGRCTITEMTAYDGPIGDRGYDRRHHHDDRDYNDDDDRDNGRHHHNGY